MPAGYSGTPLVKKLGIKEGFKIHPYNQPDHYFELLEDLPESIEIIERPEDEELDFVHLFVTDKDKLEDQLLSLKKKIKKNGMIWVSWPKGKSKIPTDVKDSIVRETGLSTGLVDIKVCAVDEDWSGLKFVYRVKDR
ncbi:DUF3052 family protein [Fulvivirgaceae bacterium BMA10]|uniref:DUF3052 family protein n=1 Tax=Splendidivirga corallicola TaxID=3051826 RepID=A0ABT8KTT4_9BACT|nr:DUF3052 family protein [Fulvivirgaceae bacterium BMA10]